jgi:hypothetical protein
MMDFPNNSETCSCFFFIPGFIAKIMNFNDSYCCRCSKGMPLSET